MSDENRRFTRIPFKMNTEIVVDDQSFITDKIINLSVGGCLLPVDVDPSPGSSCKIKIALEGTSDNITITIEGEVVRKTDQGLAINFIRIDPESLFHLQNIVRYNSPDADIIESEINKHPGIR